MHYTILSLAALVALTTALPVVPAVSLHTGAHLTNKHQAQLIDTKPGSTIELGKPSTVVTWGKRDLVDVEPDSTIELGEPSTEISWGKRDLTFEPSQSDDTIELGKPSTEITWGKRDLIVTEPGTTIELGQPSTEVTWGKE